LQLCKCFTVFDVATGLSGDASDYNEDKRSAVAARMQNKVVVEWEQRVRFWPFGPHWSSRQETEMCVVLPRLTKTKNSTCCFQHCQRWHLAWQNWTKFFRRDVLSLH